MWAVSGLWLPYLAICTGLLVGGLTGLILGVHRAFTNVLDGKRLRALGWLAIAVVGGGGAFLGVDGLLRP